jgi:hypothetical protein
VEEKGGQGTCADGGKELNGKRFHLACYWEDRPDSPSVKWKDKKFTYRRPSAVSSLPPLRQRG